MVCAFTIFLGFIGFFRHLTVERIVFCEKKKTIWKERQGFEMAFFSPKLKVLW